VIRAQLSVELSSKTEETENVVAVLMANAPVNERQTGVVLVGAHYDHLGFGGAASLAPEKHEPHLGADDNASGVAGMLEVARLLSKSNVSRQRDVVFVAFSGEEAGVLGSTYFTRTPPPGMATKDIVAMFNLDMVGRMRSNMLNVLGATSAKEWEDLVQRECAEARINCTAKGSGYGPSDHTPFYAAGVPVLHFFTGAHSDYHKPSDSPDKINASGLVQVAEVVAGTAMGVANRKEKLTYQNVPEPASFGDMRGFRASLGTVPDYAGPPNGQIGVLLAGVRPGGAAEKAGLQRGDILLSLGNKPVGNVEDFMVVLNSLKPGQTVPIVVRRQGKNVTVNATLQESR
jgi:Iap family predicted aminopeptidase